MATDKLCRGNQCPNRAQCRWYQQHVANPEKQSISKCPEGKWFERNSLDHPQMKGSYPRGC